MISGEKNPPKIYMEMEHDIRMEIMAHFFHVYYSNINVMLIRGLRNFFFANNLPISRVAKKGEQIVAESGEKRDCDKKRRTKVNICDMASSKEQFLSNYTNIYYIEYDIRLYAAIKYRCCCIYFFCSCLIHYSVFFHLVFRRTHSHESNKRKPMFTLD